MTATPAPPRRAIAYVRQSLQRSGEKADTSLSLDAQIAAIEQHAERHGYQLVETIRDHDLKGDDWSRPGLQDAISKASKADALIVFALSRLARDNILQETVYRQLRAVGCQLVSVTEPAAADTLTRQILGAVAQSDKERMGKFLSAAFRQKQLRGEHHGAAPLDRRTGG